MSNSLLRTEQIIFGDVTITVQCTTLLTQVRRDAIVTSLGEAKVLGEIYLAFYLNAVTQTQQAKGLPFTLPSYAADVETHLAAFEQCLNLPTELLVQWNEAIERVNKVPGAAKEADDPKAYKRVKNTPLPSTA